MTTAIQSTLTSLQQIKLTNYMDRMCLLIHGTWRSYTDLLTVTILVAVGYDYGELRFCSKIMYPSQHRQSLHFQMRYDTTYRHTLKSWSLIIRVD